MSYMDRDRWKHRRRMAYAALIGGLAFPLLVLFGSGTNALTSVAGPFYVFVGMVLGGYIGFATWDDQKNRPVQRRRTDIEDNPDSQR